MARADVSDLILWILFQLPRENFIRWEGFVAFLKTGKLSVHLTLTRSKDDLLGTICLGMSEAACLIACLHPAPPTGITPKGFNIQNIPLFFFGVFSFNFCTSKSQPRWEEPRAPSEKTVHSSPGTGGEENQNILSNQINQFPIFIFCDAPVSFLLSE